MFGYWGRILRIDLTHRTTSIQVFEEDWARKWLGGRGMASALLWEELDEGTEALSADNRLILIGGPITGSPIAGTGRSFVMGRSPLTGGYGESSAGGGLGPNIKRAGYDAILIEGASESPVYVWIRDSEVAFRDASHLWGMITGDAEDRILEEIGDPKAVVGAIGPGGERQDLLACIISEKHRAWGRTGLGAVMGFKNLKAIVVRGTQKVPVAGRDALKTIARRIFSLTMDGPRGQAIKAYGTALGVGGNQVAGILPTKNFQMGVFDGYQNLTGERMAETIMVSRYACPYCPIGCVREVSVPGGFMGEPVTPDYGGPEYETIAAFGSDCMVDSLEATALASQLCNMYGLDTISAGNTIAWAMECYEKGILTKSDLDGIELRWGDAAAMISLLKKMCKGEGIGVLLAQGLKRASQEIGQGSADFALFVKGLEVPFHEPRGKVGVGLMYATSPRGAVHTGYAHDPDFEKENVLPELGITKTLSRFSVEGKPPLMKITNDAQIGLEMLGTCLILYSLRSPVRTDEGRELLKAVVGWDVDQEEFLTIGERANNMARSVNARFGKTRKDDTLPKRFTEPLLDDGPSGGHRIAPEDFTKMLDEYYAVRGWDANGVPSQAKLDELGIGYVTDQFPKTQP